MHKKKNPLRVLSGELVLNFRKQARSMRVIFPTPEREATAVVRSCSEVEIVRGTGATTETLHHAVVPKLLESGLLAKFSKQYGDLTPLLKELFDFAQRAGKWQRREDRELLADLSPKELARYWITRLLARLDREGRPPTESQVLRYLQTRLGNGQSLGKKTGRALLHQVGYSPDKRHWRPAGRNGQQEFLFT